MLVQLALDRPNAQYTNLDVISGHIRLRVQSNTNVSSVVVKLEGESRTRLVPPSGPPSYNDRQKPEREIHKLLYKVQVVWPPPALQQGDPGWNTKSYTLNSGQYNFPFEFKIPFNNACSVHNSLSTNLLFSGLQLDVAKQPTRHIKATLPPPIYFPGEAEIRYYVKVTVNRPQLFKENPRAFANFNFFPIEPPRSERSDGETYARRQHQFMPTNSLGLKKKASKPNIFTRKPSGPSTPNPLNEPAKFSVDVRLPNPAIITCNTDLPLRVLLKQMNERSEQVYLQILQIEMIGYTRVNAQQLVRTESNSWVIVSMSNMAIPLGSPNDPAGTEVEINKEYWQDRPLPNTVAPTFTTCNLSRSYELEVRVGLGYGNYKPGRDQLYILPLRLPVKVFSGIAPPAKLLNAMATKPPRRASGPVPQVQPASSASNAPPNDPGYEDAPPSYEDAIAEDLPPLPDGPRPNYAPPPPSTDGESRISSDEKRR